VWVRVGYAGYDRVAEAGGWHVRRRVLLSALGIWGKRDPLGYVDGQNVHEYASSGPVRYVDPTGLISYWGTGGPGATPPGWTWETDGIPTGSEGGGCDGCVNTTGLSSIQSQSATAKMPGQFEVRLACPEYQTTCAQCALLQAVHSRPVQPPLRHSRFRLTRALALGMNSCPHYSATLRFGSETKE